MTYEDRLKRAERVDKLLTGAGPKREELKLRNYRNKPTK